jgi:hypothetical protein
MSRGRQPSVNIIKQCVHEQQKDRRSGHLILLRRRSRGTVCLGVLFPAIHRRLVDFEKTPE